MGLEMQVYQGGQSAAAIIEQAERYLAMATSIEDFADVQRRAEALAALVTAARLGAEAVHRVAEIKVRAERTVGAMLATRIQRRGEVSMETMVSTETLTELKITKVQAHRWRTIAMLPEAEFERHIVETRLRDEDLTTRSLYQLALEHRRIAPADRPVGDAVVPLVAGDHEFLEGDCREILPTLPTGAFQGVVTSVPYWRQRDYQHPAQIGLEATPEEWLGELLAVFREVRRVVDQGAALWLNVGDKYQASGFGWQVLAKQHTNWSRRERVQRLGMSRATPGYKKRDLTLLPLELAAALRNDGWYLRQTIIWSKGVATEPVRDERPSSSHEYLFLLTAGERSRVANPGEPWWQESVWTIRADPSSDHPAKMPDELVRRCIVSSSSTGQRWLDIFAGICTTARVASQLGRSSTSIELIGHFLDRGRRQLGAEHVS